MDGSAAHLSVVQVQCTALAARCLNSKMLLSMNAKSAADAQ